MKGIKQKMVAAFAVFVVALVLSMVSINTIMSKRAINKTIMDVVPEIVEQAATAITNKLSVEMGKLESKPYVDESNNIVLLNYAVPIKSKDKIIGVLVASKPENEIIGTTKEINLLETGSATIFDGEGVTVADNDESLVLNKVNLIEEAKTNKEYENIAKAITTMIGTTSGIESYTYNGKKKYMIR
ncbi:MAG: hypothetical protein E7214_06905 [Clostridium sp.]|nr:hypothetical protein [Clostridium sp.]